jgi:bisphosphoglycerate-independent phosphoglycerate mutase (AlkP superfamily)
LDGWGENINKDEWNAIHIADTPTTDGLRKLNNRWRTVQAHGKAVGLPSDAGKLLDQSIAGGVPQLSRLHVNTKRHHSLLPGAIADKETDARNGHLRYPCYDADMGNSEVGHNAL